MSSKNLHKHALPIVSLTIAGILITVGLSSVLTSSFVSKNDDLVSAATNRSISITPTSAATAKLTTRNTTGLNDSVALLQSVTADIANSAAKIN